MERNKWEDEFKDKLSQREITPTPHAWERLDAMLNEADSNQTPNAMESRDEKVVRKLTWLYIAAGIVAFLLVATFYFNVDKTKQANEVVEQTPTNDNGLENDQLPTIDTVLQNSKEPTQVAESQAAPNQIQRPIPAAISSTKKTNLKPSQPLRTQVQVAQHVNKPQFEGEMPEQKIEKIAAAERHADQQLTLADPKLQNPKSVKVDARSLLSQVDGELDLTFREKTIKTINKKYKDVKVALANRNNQE
jgi:hypothetical protein